MIFLSHSSADKAFVRFLASELQAFGYTYWLDENDLGAGQTLSASIENAIHASERVLVFISQASVLSDWVRREIAAADEQRTKKASHGLIPCLIGGITDTELPEAVRDILYVDFRCAVRYDQAMARLLSAIAKNRKARLPNFDGDRSSHLAAVGRDSAVRGWLLEFLVSFVSRCIDDTERYWIYITIAELGTKEQLSWFSTALANEQGFARKGVLEALEILNWKLSA